MPPPDPGFASRVGRSGSFLILVKVSLVHRALVLFDKASLLEEPLFVTIVIIDNDKALVNKHNDGIGFK